MKRLLTKWMTGLLLAGGLTSSAFAQHFAQQAQQYQPAYGSETMFSEEAILGTPVSDEPGTYWDPEAPVICDPTWGSWCKGFWVDGEAIWLQRSVPEDVALVSRTNNGTGLTEAELTTRSSQFDYESGFRVMMGWQLFRQISLEGGYFGLLDDHMVGASLAENAGTTLVSHYLLGDLNDVNYQLRSRLHSAEINLRFTTDPARKCYAAVLTGFRYLDISETLAVNDMVGNTVAQSFNSDVHNYLYGYQIGGELGGGIGNELKEIGAVINGKFGFLGNSAVNELSNSANDAYRRNNGLGFANSIEFNAAVKYRYHWLAVRAGYQFLCVNGVALAPNQAQTIGAAPGPNTADTLNQKSSIIYHGPFVGAEVTWPPTLR